MADSVAIEELAGASWEPAARLWGSVSPEAARLTGARGPCRLPDRSGALRAAGAGACAYPPDTDDGLDRQPQAAWAMREAARTPARFRDRVIAQFRSPANLAYLRDLFEQRVPRGPLRQHVLATLHDAAVSYSEGEGPALDLLLSDPIAQRGGGRPAVGLWEEVRRLNRAFYEDRLSFLRDQAHIIERRAPRDGVSEDEEPYHMRMFIADSLRPPGLEHLNTPGPLYALREDQSTWYPPPGTGMGRDADGRLRGGPFGGFPGGPHGGGPYAGPSYGGGQPESPPKGRREGFSPHPYGDLGSPGWASPPWGPPPAGDGDPDVFLYGEEDAPWSAGRANRTPEQAVAEYWGDGWTATDTMTGHTETMGRAYGGDYGWGDTWQENGGSRFMRFPSIPYWQKGGREGYDGDIEETLGTQARELDGHVRRWSMEILRNPRGQEYRRYGPRTGHVV